jgi:hypothetical protein
MRPAGEQRFDEIRADGDRPGVSPAAFLVLDGAMGGIFRCLIADGLLAPARGRMTEVLRHAVKRLLLAPGTFVLALVGLSASALAQGHLEARYSATLANIPIGSGTWTIDINDNQYAGTATGTTGGLLRAFTSGQGSSSARATLTAGRITSSIYASTITSRKKADTTRITISSGNVKDFSVDPPQDNDPERVPVTEAHQHGVLDPMTALFVRVPGSGELLSPGACQHTLAVFDGRLRYDLQLAFKRMDKVKPSKGYAGPVVVCSTYFLPVAGYIPSRAAVKYLAQQRDMEVWLAPIAGTRVLVPFRVQGPTPIGEAVLEASEFISVPVPARASANGSKTQ